MGSEDDVEEVVLAASDDVVELDDVDELVI